VIKTATFFSFLVGCDPRLLEFLRPNKIESRNFFGCVLGVGGTQKHCFPTHRMASMPRSGGLEVCPMNGDGDSRS
jgi:hypothetical protein